MTDVAVMDLGSADPAAEAPAAAPAPEAPAAAPPAAAAPVDRVVEFKGQKVEIPENFWDPEAKAANLPAMLKANADLRTQLSKLPKAPDAYDLAAGLSDDAKKMLNLDAKDPFVEKATGMFKARNLDQDTVSALVGLVVERDMAMEATAREAEKQAATQARADAVKAVGSEAALKATIEWWKEVSGGQPLVTSAAGVKMLADLRQKLGGAPVPSGRDGAGDQRVTEDGLKIMMKDPRYWKTKDPAFIQQVADGFKALYPS